MAPSTSLQSPPVQPTPPVPVAVQVNVPKPQLPRRRTRRNISEEDLDPKATTSLPPVQTHKKAITDLSSTALHAVKARMAEDLSVAASTSAETASTADLDFDGQDVWVTQFPSDGPSPPPSHVQPLTVIGNQRRPPVSLRITIGSAAPPQPQPQRPVPRSLPRLRQPTAFVDEEATKKDTPQPPTFLESNIVASPVAEVSLTPTVMPESQLVSQWRPLGNVRTSLPRRRTKNAAPSTSPEPLPATVAPVEPLVELMEVAKTEAAPPPTTESPPRKPRSLGLPKLKQNSVRNRFLQEDEQDIFGKLTGEGNPVFMRRSSHSYNAH